MANSPTSGVAKHWSLSLPPAPIAMQHKAAVASLGAKPRHPGAKKIRSRGQPRPRPANASWAATTSVAQTQSTLMPDRPGRPKRRSKPPPYEARSMPDPSRAAQAQGSPEDDEVQRLVTPLAPTVCAHACASARNGESGERGHWPMRSLVVAAGSSLHLWVGHARDPESPLRDSPGIKAKARLPP